MKRVILLISIVFCLVGLASAQPRIVEKKPEKPEPAAIAPETFKAKYEGGMFGFSKKEEGSTIFYGRCCKQH